MKQQRRLQNYFSDGKFSAATIVKPPGLSHKMMKEKRKERWKRERHEGRRMARGVIERMLGGGIETTKPIETGIQEEKTRYSVCVSVGVCEWSRKKIKKKGEWKNWKREWEKWESFNLSLGNYLSCWCSGLEIIRCCNSTSLRMPQADYRTIALSLCFTHVHRHTYAALAHSSSKL